MTAPSKLTAVVLAASLVASTEVAQAGEPREVSSAGSESQSPPTREVAPSTSMTPVRDGHAFPCLSGVCLGDVATNHITTVEWVDLAKEARAAIYLQKRKGAAVVFGEKGTREVEGKGLEVKREDAKEHEEWVSRYVKGLTREEQDLLVQYVALGKMDRRLLTLLRDRRPVFCRSRTFQGLFVSGSGYKTSVWASVTSAGTLRVTAMSRLFPADDSVRLSEIEGTLVKQYPFLKESWNAQTRVSPFSGARR